MMAQMSVSAANVLPKADSLDPRLFQKVGIMHSRIISERYSLKLIGDFQSYSRLYSLLSTNNWR